MPSQPLRLYQGETHTYICYKIHTVYKSLYAEQQRKKKKEWKKNKQRCTHTDTRTQTTRKEKEHTKKASRQLTDVQKQKRLIMK